MRILLLTVTISIYSPLLFAEEPVSDLSASAEGSVMELTLEKFDCRSGPYKPNLPSTIKGFQALGNRTKEQVQPASDYTGDPTTHTSGNFWYDGMFLGVVIRNIKPYGSFLEAASFSNQRWNNLTPIKIGSSIFDLLAKEKISANPTYDSVVLLCGATMGAADCTRITLKKHVIIKVEYECYTG